MEDGRRAPTLAELEGHLRREPYDDDAWLVYADWLLEQGDARGELLQLEHGPRTEDAARSIAALEKAHREAWLGGIPDEVAPLETHAGFVLHARYRWSERGAEPLAELLALPGARLLHTLELRGDGGELSGLSDLDLRRLVVLDCAYVPIGPAGAAEIARARLEELRALDLRYGRIEDAGADALASSPTLARLERLLLQRSELGPEGAVALAGGAFVDLDHLDLRYSAIGERGADALARAPFARTLRRLALYPEDVGAAGAHVLAEAEALSPRIRRLWCRA